VTTEELAMNVVVRGLMAAGMAVYAVLHAQQALSPPEGAPGWLQVAFAAAAIAGLGLAVMLIATSVRTEATWTGAAAALAGASALALLAAYTVGFFGVQEADLRPETALVAVAELVVLVAYAIDRRVLAAAGHGVDEVNDARPRAPRDPAA
jgi:hypothetical protein